MLRDNEAVLSGDIPLRYGFHDVAGNPCRVAAQVAAVLIARGWSRLPKKCSPDCTVIEELTNIRSYMIHAG